MTNRYEILCFGFHTYQNGRNITIPHSDVIQYLLDLYPDDQILSHYIYGKNLKDNGPYQYTGWTALITEEQLALITLKFS